MRSSLCVTVFTVATRGIIVSPVFVSGSAVTDIPVRLAKKHDYRRLRKLPRIDCISAGDREEVSNESGKFGRRRKCHCPRFFNRVTARSTYLPNSLKSSPSNLEPKGKIRK